MEHNKILVANDVRNTVSIVRDWSESAASREHVRMLLEVDQIPLRMRRLRGGESPFLRQSGVQEF